jgi:hypothetical protein
MVEGILLDRIADNYTYLGEITLIYKRHSIISNDIKVTRESILKHGEIYLSQVLD